MNKLIVSLLGLMIVGASLEACVTYDPSTRTYTVDKSGCVKHGGQVKKTKSSNR